jgi:hypothetical protein
VAIPLPAATLPQVSQAVTHHNKAILLSKAIPLLLATPLQVVSPVSSSHTRLKAILLDLASPDRHLIQARHLIPVNSNHIPVNSNHIPDKHLTQDNSLIPVSSPMEVIPDKVSAQVLLLLVLQWVSLKWAVLVLLLPVLPWVSLSAVLPSLLRPYW